MLRKILSTRPLRKILKPRPLEELAKELVSKKIIDGNPEVKESPLSRTAREHSDQ